MKTTKKQFFSLLFVLALVIGFLTGGKVLADGATKKRANDASPGGAK